MADGILTIDTIALNCLVFEKIAFLRFGDRQIDRQTNKQTDGQHRCTKPLSCRERRLNKLKQFVFTIKCNRSRFDITCVHHIS